MKNRIKVAQFTFFIGTFVGVLSADGGALTAAAFSAAQGLQFWIKSLVLFVPISILWSSFCYLAYKGFTSNKIILKFIFWLYVVFNVFIFPIGTVIAGVSVWLWRDSRIQNIDPGIAPNSEQ